MILNITAIWPHKYDAIGSWNFPKIVRFLFHAAYDKKRYVVIDSAWPLWTKTRKGVAKTTMFGEKVCSTVRKIFEWENKVACPI